MTSCSIAISRECCGAANRAEETIINFFKHQFILTNIIIMHNIAAAEGNLPTVHSRRRPRPRWRPRLQQLYSW